MTPSARLGPHKPASRMRLVARPRDGFSLLAMVGVVVAVIVGLLAMHVIAPSAGGHGSAATMTMGAEAEDGMAARYGGAPANAVLMSNHMVMTAAANLGESTPDHTMADMACVLALLFGTLTLLGSAASQRPRMGTFEDGHGALEPDSVAGAREQEPPPDLNVLSISRT